MIPSTVTQLLLMLTFVVPGFVYQSVRIAFRGRFPNDVELSTRLVRSIVTSAIFGLIYLIALGDWVLAQASPTDLVDDVRKNAATALVGGVIFPALVAALAGFLDLPDWRLLGWAKSKLSEIPRYDPTPTAWDKAFQDAPESFVRVLNKEGRWVAGYFGTNSYATSYPEPQQVFLEKQYAINADGEIEDEIPGTLGCIVECVDAQVVAILAADSGGEQDA